MHHFERDTPARATLLVALVAAMLFMALGTSGFAQGANSPTIQRLEVAFWPEYDRPEVLVMYRGELDPTALLPAQIAIPIPAEVGEPHAVAWRNVDGGLMMAQHTLDAGDGQSTLNITVPSHSFRVEYYQALAREGDRKSFTFQWPGGPAITQLAYEIQQPMGATGMEVSPIPGGQGMAGDGLTYMKAELGAVAAGAATEIKFTYDKPSDALTTSVLAPAAPPPPPASATPASTPAPVRPPTTQVSATQWWPVYVALALLVGLVAGIALQRRNR